MVLFSCIPRGSASSSGFCSGSALHAPVWDVVTSFYCFYLLYCVLLYCFVVLFNWGCLCRVPVFMETVTDE